MVPGALAVEPFLGFCAFPCLCNLCSSGHLRVKSMSSLCPFGALDAGMSMRSGHLFFSGLESGGSFFRQSLRVAIDLTCCRVVTSFSFGMQKCMWLPSLLSQHFTRCKECQRRCSTSTRLGSFQDPPFGSTH